MTRIAIIGGGIGGLSAALALRQFGFEPQVFEQAPKLLEVGAAIAVWPNALRILQALGIGDKVISRAGLVKEIRWLDWKGRCLNKVRFSGPAGHLSTPPLALHRADLQAGLLGALPLSSINLGSTFRDFGIEDGTIEARFTNQQSATCDLLIGADGLHSRVRAQVVEGTVEASSPVDRGYAVWRGITKSTPSDLRPETAVEIHGCGKRFGIGPVGLGRIGWWATANMPATTPPAGDDGLAGRGGKESTHQQDLLTHFAGIYQPALNLIEATPENSILKTIASDRPASKRWGRDCVTLLGDAIHPTTPNLGQGGCMAIEDAIVLARCLYKYAGAAEKGSLDVAAALRRYAEVRYGRTSAIARYSRRYGDIGQWESPFAGSLRGWTLSLLPEFFLHRLLQMIFSYDAYAVSV